MTDQPLIILAKSAWNPPIRREHALARLAAAHGHPVSYLERPLDVRGLRARGARRFIGGLSGSPISAGLSGVQASERATLLPAHLHPVARRLDSALLRRLIARRSLDGATVVATLPWHWPALSALPTGTRRVLDVADDWSTLMPARSAEIKRLYARAAEEADAVIVVSERLQELFPGRPVKVVRNGLDESLLGPSSEAPGACRLAYLGTLSERFDAPLVGALLDALPGWSIDLFGPCAYARCADAPGAELQALLARGQERVRWHGPVDRHGVAGVLDAADVLLLPNRGSSRGQDSMKIYDYAARGRSIVATAEALQGISELPPHLYVGRDAPELAQAVLSCGYEPAAAARKRRAWADGQAWGRRWPDWSAALFGAPPLNTRAPARTVPKLSQPQTSRHRRAGTKTPLQGPRALHGVALERKST